MRLLSSGRRARGAQQADGIQLKDGQLVDTCFRKGHCRVPASQQTMPRPANSPTGGEAATYPAPNDAWLAKECIAGAVRAIRHCKTPVPPAHARLHGRFLSRILRQCSSSLPGCTAFRHARLHIIAVPVPLARNATTCDDVQLMCREHGTVGCGVSNRRFCLGPLFRLGEHKIGTLQPAVTCKPQFRVRNPGGSVCDALAWQENSCRFD